MCGIAGHINYKGGITGANITAMSEAIRHRGPDGDGSYINASQTAGLGHRRLSFLDLSEAGKQPMTNEDSSLWITYNGEVYNYIELRQELEKHGHTFRSHCDTEVILHGYERWGPAVLQRLKGMFAFAIWNEKTRELFVARDRFGIKPLYYYHQNGNFIFGSEIKAIKANSAVNTTLNISSFTDYFVYRYIPSPKTIWNEVKKLPPAHYLILSENGAVETTNYWTIPFAEKTLSDKEAIEKYDELLFNSVYTHARSDVPVGSFLSGGYDSSALVYYMSRFDYTPSTFSIGFEGWDVSEHLFAGMVAKQYGTDHHSLILQSQSLDLLDHLSWVYDEPNGDISIIPTYLVSQEASKRVKAVMSGEGADEMLVGYQWQKEYQPQSLSLVQRLKSLFQNSDNPYIVKYYAQAMAMGRFDTAELQKLLQPDLHKHINANPDWFYSKNYRADLPGLKSIQQMDVSCFMGEQVLVKVDRASMANSLEVRVPFLDHEICEFVMGLKSSVYYKPEETKHLLYQNIKNHFPQQILERKKQGFVGPDKYYMNMDWYQQRLSDSKLAADGIVNPAYIQSLLDKKDHWRLWKVAVMETWYRRWV
ncbi:MAG TPA: asparagine synthase (glutamine-hydrolyzing) [Chitinophagales bacterium]|nr:asparagine synthase (glutamine-hydrolyzing) [Chitinophagales bacterium]